MTLSLLWDQGVCTWVENSVPFLLASQLRLLAIVTRPSCYLPLSLHIWQIDSPSSIWHDIQRKQLINKMPQIWSMLCSTKSAQICDRQLLRSNVIAPLRLWFSVIHRRCLVLYYPDQLSALRSRRTWTGGCFGAFAKWHAVQIGSIDAIRCVRCCSGAMSE